MSIGIMKQALSLFLSILITLGFGSCSNNHKQLSPAAYVKFFQSKDAVRTIVIGATRYEIQIVPAELMALREAIRDIHVEPVIYNRRLEQIKGNLYFSIRIYSDEKSASKYDAFSYYEKQAKQNL